MTEDSVELCFFYAGSPGNYYLRLHKKIHVKIHVWPFKSIILKNMRLLKSFSGWLRPFYRAQGLNEWFIEHRKNVS